MACGSCGQKRAVVSEAAAQQIVTQGPRAKYTVTAPDGTRYDTDDIFEAQRLRIEVNGVLTTTTG